jgi:hypothetical protein
MPESSASDLAKELREATLNYLWRQWRAVGAMTNEPAARIVVDPEVLLLMSLRMIEQERRLADLIWSWTEVNSSLLSIQRLGNLAPSFPANVGQRLSGLAEYRVRETKDPRWKSLQRDRKATLGQRPPKLRATKPRFNSSATLLLQLRLGLGVGVKADVLTFVLGTNTLGQEWSSVSTIAEALGYTPVSVRRATNELARAKFILTLNTGESDETKQRMFSAQPGTWNNLLGHNINYPGWGYWWERYRFVSEVLNWLEGEEGRQTSSYAQDVKARELLTRHGPALRKDRILDPLEFAAAELNWNYLVSSVRSLETWLQNQG